jgi:hypothetical protein
MSFPCDYSQLESCMHFLLSYNVPAFHHINSIGWELLLFESPFSPTLYVHIRSSTRCSTRNAIILDVTQCSPIEVLRRFGGNVLPRTSDPNNTQRKQPTTRKHSGALLLMNITKHNCLKHHSVYT